jgi:rubrerythrin
MKMSFAYTRKVFQTFLRQENEHQSKVLSQLYNRNEAQKTEKSNTVKGERERA